MAAAAVTLAACAGAVTVSGHKNISGSYRVSELYTVATGNNELRTIIIGGPFNLRNVVDADAICRGSAEALEVQPAGERFTVTGVYCAGNLPLTQATARIGQVPGIDSKQFNDLMGQLTIALFPARDRRRRDSQG
jgi:hypothetical protein